MKKHVEMHPVAEVTGAKGLTYGNRPNLPIGTLLFTAAQLRQAKVEVLREAADWFRSRIPVACDEFIVVGHGFTLAMAASLEIRADEIEKGERE